uniref:Uncharacterized protein n=1 Tax=Hucho hucho TaxID=62062 RepID=A0A4W5MEV9_9TELE
MKQLFIEYLSLSYLIKHHKILHKMIVKVSATSDTRRKFDLLLLTDSSGDLILHTVLSGNVTGVWRHIEAVGSELRGLFKSAETIPGAMGPEQQAKPLVVVSNQGLQTSVALSVLWEADVFGKTLWMLRSVDPSPADNWKSTR